MTERDMEVKPYSAEEQRVCEHLLKITNNQVGCGDDPIGFILCSHNALRRERDYAVDQLADRTVLLNNLTRNFEVAEETLRVANARIAELEKALEKIAAGSESSFASEIARAALGGK